MPQQCVKECRQSPAWTRELRAIATSTKRANEIAFKTVFHNVPYLIREKYERKIICSYLNASIEIKQSYGVSCERERSAEGPAVCISDTARVGRLRFDRSGYSLPVNRG